MNRPEQAAVAIVLDAAEMPINTPPAELAAALQASGYDRPADHIRLLGVAMTLYRAHRTLPDAEHEKITPR